MNAIAMLASVSTLVLTTVSAAQTTWQVTGGGFALRHVMSQIAPGDTVIVGPGYYVGFSCLRGATIRAAQPGTVVVNPYLAVITIPACGCTCIQAASGRTVLFAPPGEAVHVVGLRFDEWNALTPCFSPLEHDLRVSGGHVTFDQCTSTRTIVADARVHLQDCTMSAAAGAGIRAETADVTIAGGSLAGTPGIELVASRLHASHSTVTATAPGSSGIHADAASSVWVSDASVIGVGACAVHAPGLLRIDRSVLTGAGAGCATSPTGAPLVGIRRLGPITTGATFHVELNGEPGALLVLYGSLRLAPPLVAPFVDQPVWIDPATLFLADVTIATSGQAAFGYPVPAVPALVGASFWLQGAGGTSLPLQTTPVVGGVVR